jgi:uncharacterized phage protein (TIGR02220 family)
MKHLFDVDIAKQYGINAAILLENIGYWIKQNEANEANFFDGRYWTFNSRRAYREMFPYMSERQIATALEKLIADGLIITGNYNKLAYDRTLWYALTKKGECILHFVIMDYDILSNGNAQNVEPIPNINTNINTNKNTNIYNAVIEHLNSKAGTSYRASANATQRHINARIAEGFTLDDFKTVIDKKCAEWSKTDMAKYLRPETLFGSKFESYLNAQSSAPQKEGSFDTDEFFNAAIDRAYSDND